MSFFIRIICKSDEPITTTEVIGLFTKVHLLSGHVTDSEILDPHFPPEGIRLVYDPSKSPISIYHADVEHTRHDMDILLESLYDCRFSDDIRRYLQHARQMLDFEIDPESIDEAAWEALDQVEGYIAYKFDGIIYVAGEGFYAHDLTVLFSMK
jgi:hypothetical protein